MKLDIHKVRRVMVGEVRVILGMRSYTRELRIVSDSGDVEITLYAAEPDLLEIEQVDDLYEPEPAA